MSAADIELEVSKARIVELMNIIETYEMNEAKAPVQQVIGPSGTNDEGEKDEEELESFMKNIPKRIQPVKFFLPFSKWKRLMLLTATQQGFAKYLEGTVKQPTRGASATQWSTHHKLERLTDEFLRQSVVEGEDRSMVTSLYMEAGLDASPNQRWDTICGGYEADEDIRKQTIYRKLLNANVAKSKNPDIYVVWFRTLELELKSICGSCYDPTIIRGAFLNGLINHTMYRSWVIDRQNNDRGIIPTMEKLYEDVRRMHNNRQQRAQQEGGTRNQYGSGGNTQQQQQQQQTFHVGTTVNTNRANVPKCPRCGWFHPSSYNRCPLPPRRESSSGGRGRGGGRGFTGGGRGRGGGGRFMVGSGFYSGGGGFRNGGDGDDSGFYSGGGGYGGGDAGGTAEQQNQARRNFSLFSAHQQYDRGRNWVYDTGATNHMVPDRHAFTELRTGPSLRQRFEAAGEDQILEVHGTGTVDGFTNVHFVPGLRRRLFSVAQGTDDGKVYVFKKNGLEVYKEQDFNECGEKVLSVARSGNLYTGLAFDDDDEDDENHDVEVGDNKEHSNISTDNDVMMAAAVESQDVRAQAKRRNFHITQPRPKGMGRRKKKTARSENESLDELHHRMGHVSYGKLKQMLRDGTLNGVKVDLDKCTEEEGKCVVCLKGKMARKPFENVIEKRSERALEVVHLDIAGPMEVLGRDGARFLFVFVDDHSNLVACYGTKRKSDSPAVLKRFISDVGKPAKLNVEVLMTDNDGVFISDLFRGLCDELGIVQRYTVAGTSEQNGKAERGIRTMTDMIRTLLIAGKQDDNMWLDAAEYGAEIRNKVSVGNSEVTPHEIVYGSKADVSDIHPFGCRVMFYVNRKRGGKRKDRLQPRAKVGYFVGLDRERTAYKIMRQEDRVIQSMRREDVVFERWVPPRRFVGTDEVVNRNVELVQEGQEEQEEQEEQGRISSDSDSSSSEIETEESSSGGDSSDDDDDDGGEGDGDGAGGDGDGAGGDGDGDGVGGVEAGGGDAPTGVPRRSQRERRPALKIRLQRSGEAIGSGARGVGSDGAVMMAVLAKQQRDEYFTELTDDPVSYVDAMQSEQCEGWKIAIASEFEAHRENGTWEVCNDVDPNTGMPAGAAERGAVLVGHKWVFKTKRDANGNVVRCKARLCAQEFRDKGKKREQRLWRQRNDQLGSGDYDEDVDLYAPVASKAGIRVVAALAALNELMIYQLDVKTAYINAVLDREVYMTAPEGLVGVASGSVVRLKKCLYGLRTSGNRWNNLLNSDLEQMGYRRTQADPSIYVREHKGDVSYVAIVVDDVLIAAKHEVEYKRVLEVLSKKYKMTDEGLLEYYVGIEVEQKPGEIILRQRGYTKQVLERYGMWECNAVATPMVGKYDRRMSPQTDAEREQMSNVDYRGAVGALRYLADTTRPEIDGAVNTMSRFSNDPGNEHWQGVKRIMRYLRGTLNYGLRYSKDGNGEKDGTQLYGYSDADYGGCEDTRRSVSGCIMMLAGGPVVWASRKQQCVTLSTMESEYVALTMAATEAIWLRNLLGELGEKQCGASILYGDNVAANLQSKRPGVTRKAKHVDVRYHFIRECVSRCDLDVKHVRSSDNLADVFTKALTHIAFKRLTSKFMFDDSGELEQRSDILQGLWNRGN